MKELLTEWRKFINEYEDVYNRNQSSRDFFAKPDTTLDGLMHEILMQAHEMYAFLYPDEPKDLKFFAPTKRSPGDGEMYVRPAMRKILDYTSIWFENHEVQEEDEDKAKALKTFVDWLERNVDEMIEINNTEDYENLLHSKAHNILRRIAEDETGNMLVALGAQLDKF
tara:strand:- start:4 stop:507 length:504 start_codon:yes stop_codon:yes gene_type:complete